MVPSGRGIVGSPVSTSGKVVSAPIPASASASSVGAPSVVAFDLDGTVLDSVRRTISPRVRDAFTAAHAAGSLLCVVSGRPINMLGPMLMSAPWLDWRITVNGACVSRAADGEVLLRRPIELDQAMDVLDGVKGLHPAWNAFVPEVTFYENRSFTYLAGQTAPGDGNVPIPGDEAELKHILGDVDFVDSIPAELARRHEPVDKLGCSFRDVAVCDEAETLLLARGDLEVARMTPYELELTRAGVTKGSAIDLLCQRLGVDEQAAVAFGDSGNDLSMTGRACTFVAVANGTEQVRDAADEVCPSIGDDGVAQWLEARLA